MPKIRLKLLLLTLLSSVLATYSQEVIAADCSRVQEVERYLVSDRAPTGSHCERYTGLQSSVGVSCFWEYQFRSVEADEFFERAWFEVTNCRHGEAFLGQKGVNHPDSYQQRKLLTDLGTYRVTRKDKGSENRTLIFLSYEKAGT